MPFVIDNSVVCGWFIDDQADAYTDGIALMLCNDRAFAPALLQMELVNVLRTGCRRGRVPIQVAHDVIDRIGALPIEIDHSLASPAELLQLSLRHDLSSYDAAYLALALRLQLPVATKDAALADAARAAGVGVVKLQP